MSNVDYSNIVDILLDSYDKNEILKFVEDEDLTVYQNDPISFFKNKLNIKHIPDDLIKIAKSVRDNKITIAQSATGVGKTYVAGAIAVWYYKCFPKSQVITAAAPPENNLREKLWGEINDQAYKNRKLFKNDRLLSLRIEEIIDKGSEDVDDISNKHAIVGKTIPTAGDADSKKAKFSGSHAPYQLFIFDEGDAIPDEIYEAIDGCMSGDNERLLVMFNPKRKAGAAYKMIKDGLANIVVLNAFTHPNVISGENLIPGAVSRDKTVQRISEWSEPLKPDEDSDQTCFEVPEFLVGCVAVKGNGKYTDPLLAGWRRITYPPFAYIVLGQYPPQNANQLISEDWINKAISRWKLYVAEYGDRPPENVSATLGMDVADQGVDFCCIAKAFGNFVQGFERWRGIDTDLSATKAAGVYAALDAFQINVEADGIGAAIPPKLGRDGFWKCNSCGDTYYDLKVHICSRCHAEMEWKRINVKKIYVSAPSDKKCDLGKFDKVRDELWWTLREWLRNDEGAMIPDIKELKEELLIPEYYENVSNGKIKVTDKKEMRKKLGRSPDYADSLIQIFYFSQRPRIRSLV